MNVKDAPSQIQSEAKIRRARGRRVQEFDSLMRCVRKTFTAFACVAEW